MKRNGIEQPPVNGREPFDLRAGRGGRDVNGRSDAARKIEQSISYMAQHLDQPLHVATLAAAVNVSPSHFSALFKSLTGSPPIDYFIHMRMQQACRLFDSTPLNVKEVAAMLGYDDPFYFSRLFKSVNRLAPNDYRQKKACPSAAGPNGAGSLPDRAYNAVKGRFSVSSSNKNQPSQSHENRRFVHSQID